MDVVDKVTRSRMMSGIKGKDTKPELLVRKALHARGLRYRLYDDALIGMPDLVFPKYHAVVFIHGCYWHGHDCHLFRLPATNTEFWSGKIAGRSRRDEGHVRLLTVGGWRVALVEAALAALVPATMVAVTVKV